MPSRINLSPEARDRPSRLGAILGEALADIAKAGRSGIPDFPEMCATCAFRPGCMTNQMGGTQKAALDVLMGIDGDAFACHHGMKEGEPTKICAGYLAAMNAPRSVAQSAIETAKARMDAATGPDEIRAAFDEWIAKVDPNNQMDDYQRGRLWLRDFPHPSAAAR